MNSDLFDAIIKARHLKNDAALGRLLGASAPQLSNQRAERLPVGAVMMININEETGMEIKEIKRLVAAGRPIDAPAVLGE